MTEGTSSNDATNTSEFMAGIAYVRAYAVLFLAHWFGSRRFDRIGQQKGFDPEDVQAYRTQKTHHLKKNFSRSRSVLDVQATAAAASEAAPEADQPKQQAEAQIAEGGAGALADGAAEEKALAGQALAGQAASKQAAHVETSNQAVPVFIISQCVLMCGLWLAFGIKKAIDDGMTGTDPWLAGLDSISRGSTDLRWSGPNCEDYRGEIWRWITYQWTHIGIGHVLANTILLIFFGVALEGHEGSLVMAVVWHVGVIAGALLWFVGGAHGYVVGTSGGVYALVGLQFMDLVMNWRERHFRRLILAILLVFGFFDSLTWFLSQDWTDSDYSFSVAVGGGIAGLVMGSVVARNYFVTDKDKRLTVVLICLGCVLVIFSWVWLGVNDAPLNIWEAGSVDGYCWVGQFFNPQIRETSYQCVRCGTEECVQEWMLKETIIPVDPDECDAQGWYFDER